MITGAKRKAGWEEDSVTKRGASRDTLLGCSTSMVSRPLIKEIKISSNKGG